MYAILWVIAIVATVVLLSYPVAWLDVAVGRFFWRASAWLNATMTDLLNRAESRERARWDDQLNHYDEDNDRD